MTQAIQDGISAEIRQHKILYLGKSINKNNITGFNQKELRKIIQNVSCDHVLIEIDRTQSRSLSGFDDFKLTTALLADRLILSIGSDALSQRGEGPQRQSLLFPTARQEMNCI